MQLQSIVSIYGLSNIFYQGDNNALNQNGKPALQLLNVHLIVNTAFQSVATGVINGTTTERVILTLSQV